MPTPTKIARRLSVSENANNNIVDVVDGATSAPTATEKLPDADEGHNKAKTYIDKADTVANKKSCAEEETPSVNNCIKNTGGSELNLDSTDANARNNESNNSSNNPGNEQSAHEESKIFTDDQLDVNTPNSNENNVKLEEMSESDNGLDKEPNAKLTEKVEGDTKKVEPCSKPRARSRTRSISSAVSSLSGGESIIGDGLTDPIVDNYGKTPLHANRKTSLGPVRKRHQKKGRALFRNNDLEPSQEAAIVNSLSKSETLPPLDDDAMSSSVTCFVQSARPRSNTIDSFRAAMESTQLSNDLDLPAESILLPEIKDSEANDGDGASLSDAKKVEHILGTNSVSASSNNPLFSPRTRSDTIDFLESRNNPLMSPRGRSRSDTIDFLTSAAKEEGDETSESYDKKVDSRPRSDTIDFLTSAVEFQVDNHDSGSVNEIHPTSVDAAKETNTKTKKVEINLNTSHSFLKSDALKEGINNTTSRSCFQASSASKGVAFGKTPKKTNRSRAASHSSQSNSLHSQGPLRKRYRTRSLSFALSAQESRPKSKRPNPPEKNKKEEEPARCVDSEAAVNNRVNDDYILTEPEDNESTSGRVRSNTLDMVFETGGRARSDTLDFLTAAVAGDMGHDLDAAVAAAADDGASFSMHHISAPSGASVKYNSYRPPRKRPRSDTIDSTASSINSAKLDFFVSVAAEQGILTEGGAHKQGDHTDSFAAGSENSSTDRSLPKRRPRSNTLEIFSDMAAGQRARSGTVDFLIGEHVEDMGNIDDVVILPDNGDENTAHGNVMDHLKALCDEPKINGSKTARIMLRKRQSSSDVIDDLASPRLKLEEEESPAAHKKKSTRKTSLSQDSSINSLTRNRLESWGGMSDLSAGGMGSSSAIAATHTALKDTGILDDVLAAAADLGGIDGTSEDASSLERTSQNQIASGGSNSLNGLAATTKKGRARTDSIASLSLASLSDTSISIAGPKVNAKLDVNTPAAKKEVMGQSLPKPVDAASVSTPSIIVDYDAIASAVHAANAAIDGMDLAAILGTPSSSKESSYPSKSKAKTTSHATKQKGKGTKGVQNPNLPARSNPSQLTTQLQQAPPTHSAMQPPPSGKSAPQSQMKAPPKRLLMSQMKGTQTPQIVVSNSKISPNKAKSSTPFPVTSINIPFVPIPKSTKTKEEMDAIRERARKAAGYVPPGEGGKASAKKPPPPRRIPSLVGSKFNPHLNPPYRPGGAPSHIQMKNRGVLSNSPHTPMTMPDCIRSNSNQTPLSYMKPPPHQTPPSTYSSRSSTLQSQQKWEDMFSCLVNFIEETREKSTKHMNEKQKAAWIWDGNVPTSYKTPCGKALGRWINNQRSAKAKGTLKDDREVRLVSTGLKWCVLTTNSWRQMLRELEIYVHEQTKDGRIWDGNVPTNYKIKSNTPPTSGGIEDEEKNLGRWVNRQRSLFQSGKLKIDRQKDLERIGLKWSVLLTTSWASMYESLREYADEKQKQSPHGWDGNVPANFKTRSNPPLSLGRWVNRQRSAYAKGRLKDEYVKKLEVVGLKWVIHVRIGQTRSLAETAEDDDDEDFVEFIQSNNSTQKDLGGTPTLSNGVDSRNVNTATHQEGSISSAALPSLPPLRNAIVDNVQASEIN
mmetsp:Transcript_39930/g.96104  ORF Transcript_39930/g.96104 Transcript_39930/m.96104 type:complete len:1615 (+) Transcript_39930:307-5151(+)